MTDGILTTSNERTSTNAATAARAASRRPRTVHIVDLENQVFTSSRKAGADDVAAWWRLYRDEIVGLGPRDLVYFGVSVKTRWMMTAIETTQKVHWAVGHAGPHGAEQALLASVYPPHLVPAYERVVIASGDGAFINFANQCAKQGLTVQVVSGEGALNARLATAATIRTRFRRERRSKRAFALAAIRAIHAASVAAATAAATAA